MSMKSMTKERLFWWVAVPVLATVLAALAVLQYRWSEQVSAATRAEMQSGLQTSLMGFRQDLARELGAACVELRMAAGDSGGLRSADFNQQFRHWQQTAAHPALVQQVYLSRNSGDDDVPLLRIDLSHNQIEAIGWPQDFERLRQHVSQMSLFPNHSTFPNRSPGPIQRRHMGHAGNRANGRSPEMFLPCLVDQSIPALVYPLRQRGNTSDSPVHPAVTWIIIQMNPSVLEKEIFPELAQKYFRGSAGLDYHVAVLAGSTGRILYSSDSAFVDQNDSSFDASLNLLGPPFRRGESPGPRPAPFALLLKPSLPAAGRPQQAQTDDRRISGMDRLVRLEPMQYSPEDGIWQIVVKHQRGSVEAAVNGLRWRHLMVSFGVLVLLAVTMALVLIASQRARRLAAQQINFVAGVSHELRTPLAVISSAAENIAHGVVAEPQQLARYSASILKQTRQLTQLVDQVLVFAATQQKLGRYQLHPVDISQAIDAALENTAGMITAAGIAVERRMEAGLPPVAADFAALSQCLQNLITNAIKYGGDARWMGIRAAAHRENGWVREVEITVEDKGIGIPPAELKHIFEPFYRSPAVAGSNVHGTGLGLPLARTVIEAMRGRLTVESAPGKGSSFTVHLPVAAGLRLPQAEAPSESIPGETAGYYP
jgi:signal transduction histidine kinase